MSINKVYAGGAVQTVASGAFTPSSPGPGGTFTVQDDTGYPTTGPFPVKLNRGLSDEEHVLISSRAGTTFTVGQRGFDGTQAQSHNDPTCEIYFDATSANLIVDHVDDVEADPHSTKLLNVTRHDLPARHVYGGASTAFGTRPTPSSVGTANAAGSSNTPAAGDHVHDIANGAIDSAALFGSGVVDQAAIGNNAVGTGELIDANVTQAKLASGLYVPIGGGCLWFDTTVPTNWFIANGQAISRTTYSTLFALWSTDFGVGDGSTTFNIPDLRGRFPLGTAAAGTGSTLGGTGGNIDHVHNLNTSSSGARITMGVGAPGAIAITRKAISAKNRTQSAPNVNPVNNDATSEATGAELTGDSDTANPPFMAVHFIIRAL